MIWSTSWGGIDYEYGYCISGDGTYIYAVGITSSSGAGNIDLALVKLDPYGNKIWNTTWGGTGVDYGYSVWADGTYIYTCGATKSFGAGQNDLFIVKWDTNGNQIWNKTWGGTGNDYGYSIYGDGTDVYTTGSTNSFGFSYTTLLLVKWDVNGNQIWNTTWYSGGGDYGNSIWSDGTYLYTSGTGSNGRLICVKWSLNGQQILNITFGGSVYENYDGYSAWGDGTYIYVTGIYFHQPPWDADPFLAKFNVYTEPFVNSPQDIAYSVGIKGQNFSWIPTDSYILNPQYVIYRNGVINTTGSWSSATSIVVNLDPYATGIFNYTIKIFDGYGGETEDEVIVNIIPDLTISSFPDVSFPEHQIGNILSWSVNDSATLLSPTYEIYKNNIIIANGTWNINSPITLNVYDFTEGIYNITIKVDDGWGQFVKDEVFVTITESIEPIDNSISINGLSSYTYEFNSTNNKISWIPFTNGSFSSRTYAIYRNETSITSGSWNSGYNISLNIDYLPEGYYNYTIIVIGDDIIAQNTTIVNMMKGIEPTGNSITINGLLNYTFEYNSTNNEIFWNPKANGLFSMQTYTIYRNGTSISSGSWISAHNITVNIDYLPPGVYNYTIVVIGDDTTAQNTTIVTVTGNSSNIITPNVPSYNIPVILFTILAFSTCISICIKKKMRKI